MYGWFVDLPYPVFVFMFVDRNLRDHFRGVNIVFARPPFQYVKMNIYYSGYNYNVNMFY
mgnify:CR=1 FL=1